jgi:hypothetical protein
VPEIYERGHAANGDYYIAMQLVLGRPLTELIRRAPLPSRRAAELALSVADFLVKLHGLTSGHAPILHSDLKPEHVLVLDDGSLRILDLGIAKTLQANKSLTTNTWASAPYASPERLDDGKVRAGDDYWALGVMLFEMASGFHPYCQFMGPEHSHAVLASAIRRTEPPAALPASCDPALAAVVRKMLAPQPAHRYQTAEEIVADLHRYLAGEETTAAAENARASLRTQVVVPMRPDRSPVAADSLDTVPTEPLPVQATAPVPAVAAAAAAAPPSAARSRRWRGVVAGVSLRTVLAFFFILLMLSEGATWVRAERLRQRIGRLDAADVPAVQSELAGMRRMSLIALAVPLRVRRPLREHMAMLADRAILDYRNDLSVSAVQWRQARACLTLAMDAAPGERTLQARARYVDGHLARIAAQGQTSAIRQARLNQAKSLFIEAARRDSTMPDPYIGLARIHAYDTRDLEALLQNIADAESRGYKPGRRERAQVGDGYKFKGDRALAQSRNASGEGRRRFLEQAASDYEHCVARFDGLTDYFDAERNLAYCQRQLARVNRSLEESAWEWKWW